MNETESNTAVPLNPVVADYLASIPSWKLAYRRFIGYRLAAGIRKRFDIRLRGVSAPSTSAIPIIAVNHLTDDDPVVILAACLAIPGMIPILRTCVHVMGEHVFQPGFLGAYVVKQPSWLSYLLFQTRIAPFMPWIGGHPVVHARTRLLIAHLYDVLRHHGNVPLRDVLGGDIGSYLPGAEANARIRSVLTFRHRNALYQSHEFSILRQPYLEKAWGRHRERIRLFVETFATFADSGRPVFIAPQGIITRDGTPAGVRSGVFQIVNAMKRDAELIPMNITYDPMRAGRALAYVTFGRTVAAERGGPKDAFNARIEHLIHCDAPVPVSQIAAEALRALAMRSESAIGVQAFRDALTHRARELAGDGYSVVPDPGDAPEWKERLDGLFQYFRKSGFTISEGNLRFDPAIILDDSIQKSGYARRWTYCYNELQARLEHRHGDFG
ncbi:MAG: hypothetical protein HUU46_03025 [Candidatus Hydrogenedentes bacterium]|nr:hypothetical protein [Candidatus Hydrogenedentota bacterium]